MHIELVIEPRNCVRFWHENDMCAKEKTRKGERMQFHKVHLLRIWIHCLAHNQIYIMHLLFVCVCLFVSFVFSSNSCVFVSFTSYFLAFIVLFESRKLHRVLTKTINRNQNYFPISKYGLAESAEKRLIFGERKINWMLKINCIIHLLWLWKMQFDRICGFCFVFSFNLNSIEAM